MYPTRRCSGSSHLRLLSTVTAVTPKQQHNFDSRIRFADPITGTTPLRQFIIYFKERHGCNVQQQQYRYASSDVIDTDSSVIKLSRNDPNDTSLPTLDTTPKITSNHDKVPLNQIQQELFELREQFYQGMEVSDTSKQGQNQDIDAASVSGTSSATSSSMFDNPSSAFNRPLEPDLSPLQPPADMKFATVESFLSLPLSAWDDVVWDQGRWLFVRRFQSHCGLLLSSEKRQQPFDSPSPLSQTFNDFTDTLTINEVQETLNLLLLLCHIRSNTKQLHAVMNHFILELRVTIELQNQSKLSNKQLRNNFQYHPRFSDIDEVSTNMKTEDGSDIYKNDKHSSKKQEAIDHFNSLSLGTVAHMIEVTIYQIMKNRYWYPNSTTAYQTMIQVAAIATVDHTIFSTTTATHHNPGANAEYWLKQQHQASRMNSQLLTIADIDSSNLYVVYPPNRYDYTTVILGWVATSKNEQLYHNTYNPYDVSQHPSVMSVPDQYSNNFTTATTPDVSSTTASSSMFNHASNDGMAANRAGQLIRQWQFLYSSSDNNPALMPTEKAYSNWLICITNGATRPIKDAALKAARECHNALLEISKRSEKDNFWPGVTLYNILMNAYSKAGDAEAAEAVLHDLIEKAKYNTYCVPDVISFTTVINAWAQIPHNLAAPERAERLFHLQQEFAAKSGLESLLPTVTTVTAVLQCWTKSNHPLAPSRAEAILKQMHEMVKAGYSKLQPNVITYNICMNIWCRSGHFDTTNKVEDLFQELMDEYRASHYSARFKPDVVTYFARMNAWERNRALTPRAIADKIESIFNELNAPIVHHSSIGPSYDGEENNKQRQLRPNQAIYNAVIRAFSNCGNAVMATKYLEAMISDYLDNKNYKAIPNRFVFHFVISAWSRKISYTGAETAEWWLNRMHHLSISHPSLKAITPNSVSYSTCLGAWARFPQGRMIIDTDPNIEAALYEINDDAKNKVVHTETNLHQSQPLQSLTMTKCPSTIAMERGQNLIQRMKQNKIRPDVYTYGAILHIISNQKQCTKHEKYSQAQRIMEKIVRDNVEMNTYILRLLKKCGIRSLPNYNVSYNKRTGTGKVPKISNTANDSEGTPSNSIPSKVEEPQLEKTTDTADVAESI